MQDSWVDYWSFADGHLEGGHPIEDHSASSGTSKRAESATADSPVGIQIWADSLRGLLEPKAVVLRVWDNDMINMLGTFKRNGE